MRRSPDPFFLARGAWGAAVAAVLLAACATREAKGPPTLQDLAKRPAVKVEPSKPADGAVEKTMAAYERFLRNAPAENERPEAMRRLADLAMESAEARAGAPAPAEGAAANTGGTAPSPGAAEPGTAGAKVEGEAKTDFTRAIEQYLAYLQAFPADPGNDVVLYQLAHAYEQNGDLARALEYLTRLVKEYPQTRYLEEANFRRGEILFATRDYEGAEQAYSTILKANSYSQFYQRALFMEGWSVYKQGRLEDALGYFFGVLDLKLIGRETEADLAKVQGLSRAERELIEDTLRVTSLCLENLQGAETIPRFMTSNLRRDYEYRIYASLGELYLKQERVKDAADTYQAFVQRNPLQAQSPQLAARVIEIYQQFGFPQLALESKKQFVDRYGARSELRAANEPGWKKAQPLVRRHLGELARDYHAQAQKSHKPADVDEAVHWYRDLLESFPQDPEAPHNTFLLGELLYENHRYVEAATRYETAAYGFDPHPQAADAGYAALLSYAGAEKAAATPAEKDAASAAEVESALHFSETFRKDPRVAPVLADAADRLFAHHDLDRAIDVAERVLAIVPTPPDAQVKVAWTVVAHSTFEKGQFAKSEHAYGEVLALTPAADPARPGFVERLAASVYKQGEQARDAGKLADAAANFDRVATVAPGSPVRINAQFDAAAARIAMKDWAGAARTLEDFRARYPGHPLQSQVTDKLAAVYLESQDWAHAAREFEAISAARAEPEAARAALWQAAELFAKAGDKAQSGRVYERYVKAWPAPLEAAEEARSRLATMAAERGDGARELALRREILAADQGGGRVGRTARATSRPTRRFASPSPCSRNTGASPSSSPSRSSSSSRRPGSRMCSRPMRLRPIMVWRTWRPRRPTTRPSSTTISARR